MGVVQPGGFQENRAITQLKGVWVQGMFLKLWDEQLWMWRSHSPECKRPAEGTGVSFLWVSFKQQKIREERKHERGMVFQAGPGEHRSGTVGYAEKIPQHL